MAGVIVIGVFLPRVAVACRLRAFWRGSRDLGGRIRTRGRAAYAQHGNLVKQGLFGHLLQVVLDAHGA